MYKNNKKKVNKTLENKEVVVLTKANYNSKMIIMPFIYIEQKNQN